jgi:hypothetical protein
MPGHRSDTAGVAPFINGFEFGAILSDKAFDSNAIISDLDKRGAKTVIFSQHPRCGQPIQSDTEMYK